MRYGYSRTITHAVGAYKENRRDIDIPEIRRYLNQNPRDHRSSILLTRGAFEWMIPIYGLQYTERFHWCFANRCGSKLWLCIFGVTAVLTGTPAAWLSSTPGPEIRDHRC